MKKIYLYILIFILLLIIINFLGVKITGIVGLILSAFGLIKYNKNELEEAKERINKAGEDIEATKHDVNTALDFFDRFFSGDNSK